MPLPITHIFLKSKLTLIGLEGIHHQLPKVKKSLGKIDSLVGQDILTKAEAEELQKTYKQALKQTVLSEQEQNDRKAEAHTTSSEAETNSKVKGITPIISGVPVITPDPTTALAEEQKVITAGATTANDLTNMIADINAVLT